MKTFKYILQTKSAFNFVWSLYAYSIEHYKTFKSIDDCTELKFCFPKKITTFALDCNYSVLKLEIHRRNHNLQSYDE